MKLVFYDGECGFCNHSVAFILKHESSAELKFAALQSPFAQTIFKEHNFPEPDFSSVYFLENGQLLNQSNAALAICRYLKKPYSWLYILKWTPQFLRDAFYKLIAHNRKKLAKDFCFSPSQRQRERFLK